MKRYLAFFGDSYYPDGGMGDFLSDHGNLDSARKAILKEFVKNGNYLGNAQTYWGHVYDMVNKEIVYKK